MLTVYPRYIEKFEKVLKRTSDLPESDYINNKINNPILWDGLQKKICFDNPSVSYEQIYSTLRV